MHFIIQTFNKQVTHDFAFMLIEALRFHEWQGTPHTFELANKVTTQHIGIPVGSVVFVQEYLNLHGYPLVKPRNVPEELFQFADRKIYNGTENDVPNYPYFAKDQDVIKSTPRFTVTDNFNIPLPPGNYQYSSLVNFTSEWRAFVWRGQLVGLNNYSGDFTDFSDVGQIYKMIAAYKSAPCAYTLDVGIQNTKTSIVEVHDFFSCGLYGFADLALLPLMLGGWFKEYIRCQVA
jgi:hypothetical protein